MPVSDDFRLAAAHLRAQADWLAAALDSVPELSGPQTWRGPVADRFASDLEDQRRRLRALADELRSTSQLLNVDADRLQGAEVLPGPVVRTGRAW